MATLKNPVAGQIQVTIRLPVALRDRLAMFATASRLSQQDIVIEALEKHLDEVDPTGKYKPVIQATPGDALQARMQQLEGGLAELGRLIQERLPASPRRSK